MRQFFRIILTKLNTQELSQEYSDYPSDIIKTIAKETKGAVSIELPTINQEETQEEIEKSSCEDELCPLPCGSLQDQAGRRGAAGKGAGDHALYRNRAVCGSECGKSALWPPENDGAGQNPHDRSDTNSAG